MELNIIYTPISRFALDTRHFNHEIFLKKYNHQLRSVIKLYFKINFLDSLVLVAYQRPPKDHKIK